MRGNPFPSRNMTDTAQPLTLPEYLAPDAIVACWRDDSARPRLDAYGYTVKAGSPTPYMVRLRVDNRPRRVMVIQFSNAGSAFVTVKGKRLFLKAHHEEALRGI